MSLRTGVAVNDCHLVEAEFLISGANGNKFTNNSTEGTGAGFDLIHAVDNTFLQNTVRGGNSFGLNNSTGNVFRSNSVSESLGFNVFFGSIGNTFDGNTIRDSPGGFDACTDSRRQYRCRPLDRS